ncbi:MAG: UxaA family hydrolase, partial [Flavobacterium sp.]
MHPNDNVLVALTDLAKGETVTFEGQSYILADTIKAKHKFAAVDFEDGDHILMYGVIVGKANQSIKQGEVITT